MRHSQDYLEQMALVAVYHTYWCIKLIDWILVGSQVIKSTVWYYVN